MCLRRLIVPQYVIPIDYGLPSFRVPEKPTDYSASNRSALLKIYMPPEVRGLSDAPPTPTMDTYRCDHAIGFFTKQVVIYSHVFLHSYAIILLEVALRMDPYSVRIVLHGNEMCIYKS